MTARAHATALDSPIASKGMWTHGVLPSNVIAGPGTVILRGTAKAGGKDVAVAAPPVAVTIVPAKKKAEPKKDEKKK